MSNENVENFMKWISKKKVSTIFHVIEIKFSVLERYFVTKTSVESFQQFFFWKKKKHESSAWSDKKNFNKWIFLCQFKWSFKLASYYES